MSVALALGEARDMASVGGAPAEKLLVGLSSALVLAVGERTYRQDQGTIDYEVVRRMMDPLDTGETTFPKRWKQAVSYSPYPEL